MNKVFRRCLHLSVLVISAQIVSSTAMADNVLTEKQKQDGWQLLFDGKSMNQWRNFKSSDLSAQWVVENGAMKLAGKGGGDILTKKAFKNFELHLEWKISEAGNSGIFILADEEGPYIYSHAPEIQILDNERHSDNKIDSHLSGSLYDLMASPASSHKVAGEWNQVRIRFVDGFLQVWQNDVQTVNITMGSSTWNTLVSNSKFGRQRADNSPNPFAGFGTTRSGHIGLQDHGDEVSFKNIKILELK